MGYFFLDTLYIIQNKLYIYVFNLKWYNDVAEKEDRVGNFSPVREVDRTKKSVPLSKKSHLSIGIVHQIQYIY